MARPPKERRVEYIPEVKYFKPAGIPVKELEEVHLTIEEVEAIRLKDLAGLNQEECALRMNISRPTFQRILVEAHRKIAEAFIRGKAVRFQGGDYKLAQDYVYCTRCGKKHHNAQQHHHGKRGKRHGLMYCPECEE